MTDLDARVAALPKKYEDLRKSGMEADTDPKSLIIKALQDKIAELQKPALHEPVTGAEINQAVHLVHGRLALRNVEKCVDMKRALESFLQGRAKPKQKEPQRSRVSEPTIFSRALDRASKGEKT